MQLPAYIGLGVVGTLLWYGPPTWRWIARRWRPHAATTAPAPPLPAGRVPVEND